MASDTTQQWDEDETLSPHKACPRGPGSRSPRTRASLANSLLSALRWMMIFVPVLTPEASATSNTPELRGRGEVSPSIRWPVQPQDSNRKGVRALPLPNPAANPPPGTVALGLGCGAPAHEHSLWASCSLWWLVSTRPWETPSCETSTFWSPGRELPLESRGPSGLEWRGRLVISHPS